MGKGLSRFVLWLGILLVLGAGGTYAYLYQGIGRPAATPSPTASDQGLAEVFRSSDLTGFVADEFNTAGLCLRPGNATAVEGHLVLKVGDDGCQGGAKYDQAQLKGGPDAGYGHGAFELRARSSYADAASSAGLTETLELIDPTEPLRSIIVVSLGGGQSFGAAGQGLTQPDPQTVVRVSLNPSPARPAAGEFHTYRVEWSAQEIRWYVDGTQVWSQPGANFTATGVRLQLRAGVTGAEDVTDKTTFPATFEVQYVAVWQEPATPETGQIMTVIA